MSKRLDTRVTGGRFRYTASYVDDGLKIEVDEVKTGDSELRRPNGQLNQALHAQVRQDAYLVQHQLVELTWNFFPEGRGNPRRLDKELFAMFVDGGQRPGGRHGGPSAAAAGLAAVFMPRLNWLYHRR